WSRPGTRLLACKSGSASRRLTGRRPFPSHRSSLPVFASEPSSGKRRGGASTPYSASAASAARTPAEKGALRRTNARNLEKRGRDDGGLALASTVGSLTPALCS